MCQIPAFCFVVLIWSTFLCRSDYVFTRDYPLVSLHLHTPSPWGIQNLACPHIASLKHESLVKHGTEIIDSDKFIKHQQIHNPKQSCLIHKYQIGHSLIT